jgi:long-chain acyl-CoA synthetase
MAATSSPEHEATGGLNDLISRIRGRTAKAATGTLDSELNLSSLDRVELMSALEDRYEVDLNEGHFASAKTVGELEQALRQAAPRQFDYRYPRWAQRWPMTWIRAVIYYFLVWPATLITVAPRVLGREHLRNVRGPVLVISNHVTYIDVGFILWALPVRLRHRLATAMGGELLYSMRRPPGGRFFLRRWLDKLDYFLIVGLFNVFPLPQRSGFRESFAFAGSLADRGYSVLVFPEGARTPDGQLHAFRSGIGLLAVRLGIPVLPMKIEGLHELAKFGKHFAPGKVRVKIGEPVLFESNDEPEAIARQLERIVSSL